MMDDNTASAIPGLTCDAAQVLQYPVHGVPRRLGRGVAGFSTADYWRSGAQPSYSGDEERREQSLAFKRARLRRTAESRRQRPRERQTARP